MWDGKFNLLAGIDLRYCAGYHNNKIIDLYDGEYFIDDSSRSRVRASNNAAAADPNWAYEKLGVGDVVYRDYIGRTQQEGAYVQGELSLFDKKLNLVLSGSLNNTGYQRKDKFYYDEEHGTTGWYCFLGGTAKFGANYNIDRHNNVFAKLGCISRAPFFANGVFLSQAVSNATNPDPPSTRRYSPPNSATTTARAPRPPSTPTTPSGWTRPPSAAPFSKQAPTPATASS